MENTIRFYFAPEGMHCEIADSGATEEDLKWKSAWDRAFRIGQKNNVLVHKIVCRNTIEERIDDIINSKKALAENVIGSGGENWITELSNEQLLNLLRLA